MANARAKSEGADIAAQKAREDSEIARIKAKELAPEFQQPGTVVVVVVLVQIGFNVRFLKSCFTTSG